MPRTYNNEWSEKVKMDARRILQDRIIELTNEYHQAEVDLQINGHLWRQPKLKERVRSKKEALEYNSYLLKTLNAISTRQTIIKGASNDNL